MNSTCTSRHRGAAEPIVWSSASARGVILLDGSGSWGAGAEAAAWIRHALAERLPDEEIEPKTVSAELTRAIAQLPDSISGDELGWHFSIAAVLFGGTHVQVTALGVFSILLIHNQEARPLVTAKRLIDDLVAAGHLSRAEAEQHEYRKILVGPFFGPGATELCWSEPVPVSSADQILIGDASIITCVAAHASLLQIRHALALRDELERLGGHSCPTAILSCAHGP